MVDLKKFDTHKIQLKYPLLIIKGSKGFLSCAYVNSDICNNTDEACAIVVGVKSHEEMMLAKIIAVSKQAENLGVKVGMQGDKALALLA